MRATIEPRDRQFLERLHRSGGGTIQDLCVESGVTATAVRQRLTRLESLGLVSRTLVKAGRGRPHFVYRISETGSRELGENYGELALILWRSIQQIEDTAVRDAILENVADEMVRKYSRYVQAESQQERFHQLGAELVRQGFDVEIDTSGSLPILRENSCPYFDLANESTEICRFEHSVYERILGTPLQLAACSLDGANSCEFHVRNAAS